MYIHAKSPVPSCSCLRKCPSLASWCIIFYERPKGTTFYWCCGRAGLECDALAGSRRKREIHRFPRSSSGLRPSSTTGCEKRTSSRCLPSDALSYQTNRTSQTGRTARMTLGVYLGEPPRMPIPQGAAYRAECQRVGSGEFFYRY